LLIDLTKIERYSPLLEGAFPRKKAAYPPRMATSREGVSVDGLANSKVLGSLVMYSEFVETDMKRPAL